MVVVLLVRYVEACPGVAELFRQTKVDYVHHKRAAVGRARYYEIRRFDIPVHEVARMDEFDPRDLWTCMLKT